MNDSLLKRHISIYSEQLRSRRLWNIFIILIFAVSFFISSSIIDFNLSKIINGFPRLGDYIVKILPNLDSKLIFENSKVVMDDIKKINKQDGIMVICNLHSLEIAKEYCDRLIGLSDGKIVFDGHPSSLTKELAEQLYDLENE